MSRFNRFALAALGLATVALYGGRAAIALRDIAGPRPVPTVAAQAISSPDPNLSVENAFPPGMDPPRRHALPISANPLRVLVNAAGTTASVAPVEGAAAAVPAALHGGADGAPATTADAEVVVVPLPAPDAGGGQFDAPPPATSVATVAELVGKFREAGYRFEDVAAGRPVPRIIIRRFPSDLRDEEAADRRKMMFLQALLPIVLYKNQEIRRDRNRLLALRDLKPGEMSGRDAAWLERLYARYRVEAGEMAELVERVDVIPPSLALAQAATESGWGTSRSAREGNALFGQYADNGTSYAIRSFDALLKSAQSYALNLNTHRAYRALRARRAELRDAGKPLDGYVLAETLDSYSELGKKYVRYVQRMIKENQLSKLDQARLVGDDAALAAAID